MKKSLGAKTVIVPAPVLCVGTYDANGKPNVMTVAWGGICCSKPPCVTVSLRKVTYTYDNVMRKKAYTVNIPSEEYVKAADYFGIASGRDIDKFKEMGLTPAGSTIVDAPYIEEFPVILECKLLHHYEIGLHTQFIGEILDVKVDAGVLDENEQIDVEKIHPFFFTPGIRKYFGAGSFIGNAFDIGKK